MTEIIKRKKALAVNPLKTSQTMGAALAFMGMNRAMPLMHGSQGCTAFAKVFFVRHFREPVPLQTTAMDQVSSVMGADGNIVDALKTICEKSSPSIIGVVTTGLAETQGADVRRALGDFRKKYPQFDNNAVVGVNTPDFSGSFESGFALAVKGIIEQLVPEDDSQVGLRKRQVNLICGANLTPGDLEYVSESLESFGLRALMIPDMSGSLDGHLDDNPFNPVTTGGLSVEDLKTAGQSIATLVIGQSLYAAAKALHKRTAVPVHEFNYLYGLDEVDRWLMCLSELSGQPVPDKWQRQRKQLQDAMLDTHFMLGDSRFGIAADPDLLEGFDRLLTSMGGTTVAAVVPAKGVALSSITSDQVQIGDLEDLERLAGENKAHMLLGNSHAVATAKRLGVPILRVGFPQYDLVGGFSRCWFGYRGTQQTLFDLANQLMMQHQETPAYYSIYSQKDPEERRQKSLAQGGH